MHGTDVSEKPSALSASNRNGLNVRIRVLRKTSDGEIEVASDLPSGATVTDFVRDLSESISLQSSPLPNESSSPSIPQQTTTPVASPSSKPATQSESRSSSSTSGPQSIVPLKLDSAEIARAAWRDHSTGKGQHALATELPQSTPALEAGPKEGVVWEGARYKLWTDSTGVKRVSRWHTGSK